MLISVTERNTTLWDEALDVVRNQYNRTYDANIAPDPQYFVVIQSMTGKILACAGVTFADESRLFSEQYLANPIENVLSLRSDREVERANIVEIGSLVSHHPTAGRILVNMIPMLAWCMGAQFLLCTATPRVRAMMASCQITFEPIEQADPSRLDNSQESWGSYYEQRPVTGFIQVDPKRSRFAAMTVSTIFTHAPVDLPKRVS
ncbi:Thermostable hemolysin [compost metagenome]